MASTNIIYKTSTAGLSETEIAQIGKLLTPLKVVIEHESDVLRSEKGVSDYLFIKDTSKRASETIVTMDEFGEFAAVPEGDPAKEDSMGETGKKIIEHIQFMKEFSITRIMQDDSNFGVAHEAKKRALAFIRAYYATKHSLCEKALINATSGSMQFNGQEVDLTTADGNPLFYSGHTYGKTSRRGGSGNANYFYKTNLLSSTSNIENALGDMESKLRNMKDENGDPLGYVADTLIIPGNAPAFEADVKKVLGSQQVTGSGNNDINIQYGNWNLVILPRWQVASGVREIMVMSSKANRNLEGNLFFNRVPLTVTTFVDNHTANIIFNGYCRFGVGFGSYKHIVRCVQSSDAVAGAASLS